MSKNKNVAIAKYYAELKNIKTMVSDSSVRVEVDLGEPAYEAPSALYNMKIDPEQCHLIMCDEHTFLKIMKNLLSSDTDVLISDGDLNALQQKLILTTGTTPEDLEDVEI